jgi:hypothetical protein
MWFATIPETSLSRPLRCLLLAALLLVINALGSFSVAVAAEVHSADGLRALRDTMSEALRNSPYQQPLLIESNEAGARTTSDIYAEIGFPFASVSKALNDPTQWCDILLSNINLKQCRLSTGASGATLTLSAVRKYNHTIDQAISLSFRYQAALATQDYLEVELLAAEGPYGTRNYRILLQATPLPGGQSFLHFSYAYESGALTRLATQAYLATFGRGKVGFTVNGRQTDGSPHFIGGMRGLVERGAMRYFLALEAYLDALAAPSQDRFEKRLDHWFSASERFPRQLHEIDRATYLELKRADQQRRMASP